MDKVDEDLEKWFRRSLKPLSMVAVTEHVLANEQQAQRAERLAEDYYPGKASLMPQVACAWCEFLPLCRAQVINGRPEPFVPMDYGLRQKQV